MPVRILATAFLVGYPLGVTAAQGNAEQQTTTTERHHSTKSAQEREERFGTYVFLTTDEDVLPASKSNKPFFRFMALLFGTSFCVFLATVYGFRLLESKENILRKREEKKIERRRSS